MTYDFEAEARRRLNEAMMVKGETAFSCSRGRLADITFEAMCRLLEEYQAFRREVSDAVEYIKALYPTMPTMYDRFILPAPVDPVRAALNDAFPGGPDDHTDVDAIRLRKALAKRGGRIVFDEEKAGD